MRMKGIVPTMGGTSGSSKTTESTMDAEEEAVDAVSTVCSYGRRTAGESSLHVDGIEFCVVTIISGQWLNDKEKCILAKRFFRLLRE